MQDCNRNAVAVNKHKSFLAQSGLKFEEESGKHYIWSAALCGAENWTLRKVDRKYLENFDIWYWRRMEKISWTDRVRNGKV